MGLAAMFRFLPQAIVSIFGGVWADRLNRKRLIIGADATIALTTLPSPCSSSTTGLNGTEPGPLWLIFLDARDPVRRCGHPDACGVGPDPALRPRRSSFLRVSGINGSIQSAMKRCSSGRCWRRLRLLASTASIFFIDVVTVVIGIACCSLTLAVPTLREGR